MHPIKRIILISFYMISPLSIAKNMDSDLIQYQLAGVQFAVETQPRPLLKRATFYQMAAEYRFSLNEYIDTGGLLILGQQIDSYAKKIGVENQELTVGPTLLFKIIHYLRYSLSVSPSVTILRNRLYSMQSNEIVYHPSFRLINRANFEFSISDSFELKIFFSFDYLDRLKGMTFSSGFGVNYLI